MSMRAVTFVVALAVPLAAALAEQPSVAAGQRAVAGVAGAPAETATVPPSSAGASPAAAAPMSAVATSPAEVPAPMAESQSATGSRPGDAAPAVAAVPTAPANVEPMRNNAEAEPAAASGATAAVERNPGSKSEAASDGAGNGQPADAQSAAVAAEPAAAAKQAVVGPLQSGPPQAGPAAESAATEPKGTALLDPSPDGASAPDPLTPAEVTGPPPAAPGASEASAAAKPMPEGVVDAVLVLVRERLRAAKTDGGKSATADEAGIAQYYADSTAPLWAKSAGVTDKGRQALAELNNAADWGLDPSRFSTPTVPASGAGPADLAGFEIALSRAVLTYARHARGGRIDPPSLSRMLDRKPRIYEPRTVLAGLAAAPAADGYLRTLHPQNRQFELLRKALVALKSPQAGAAPDVRLPDGPSLRPGERHPHVALLRTRLKTVATDGVDAELYDDALRGAVEAYQRQHSLSVDGIVGAGTRRALNGTARGTPSDRRRLLIANMERWRWMPDDLGTLHVWSNVPEQMARVYDNGQAVFSEKIVVGKPATPTANFSADMKFVIFHPTWGVPDGIKTNELAPLLRRTSNNNNWFFGGGGRSASSVLQGVGGLQASIGGRPVNPDSVDWANIDIRRVSFTQPAGGRNVLGIVKFRFPNKHDIYMHDTPERHLFNSGERAFSHGCMRVQNPMRLAEVLLARDKGMSASAVRAYADRSSTQDVNLSKPIPVHVVYFTAVAGEDGKVRTFRDLYGVDGRVASALEGRTVHIADVGEQKAAKRAAEPRRERRRGGRQQRASTQPSSGSGNPFASVFAN